jgi:hypothetical protein
MPCVIEAAGLSSYANCLEAHKWAVLHAAVERSQTASLSYS